MDSVEALERIAQVLVTRSRVAEGPAAQPALRPTPLLAALERAGTGHLYGDTADVDELGALLAAGPGAIRRELDGNTANQPLVGKVIERHLDRSDPRTWAAELTAPGPELPRRTRLPLLYAIVCARVGNDMARAFGAGREWEASLQLHMGLGNDPAAARWIGLLLRRAMPSAFVKVPFTPDAPHCLLVARDLERAGVPVNLTSTFSARQVVAAALLADVRRSNVFLGRLNQGLRAERLGEHVALEAQRALRRLREQDRVRTLLIVASLREWQTFERVAGCDVFTAPCEVLCEFLAQDELAPEQVRSRLDTSYEDRLGIAAPVLERLGPERIARLYRVEPEFVEFLRALRQSPGYERLEDGELLHEHFARAGFADLFHVPSEAERQELERGKLPELDGLLVERIPLDTHYSLLANADFARHQTEIDAAIEKRIAGA